MTETRPESGVGRAAMTASESRCASLRAAAAVLFPIGLLEVLALAPREQWLWSRVWLTQAAGVILVVAMVGGAAAAARGLAARLGRRWPAGDAVAVLAMMAIAYAHLQPLLVRWIGPGGWVALFVLGLVVAVAFLGLKRLTGRGRLPAREERLVIISLLALPVGVTAIHRALIFSPAFRPPLGAWIAATVLYFVAVSAAIRWGGRRRSALLAATLAFAVVALRFSTPNPHQLVTLPTPVGAGDRAAAAAGPPVLLIVLDTLRADAVDLTDPATSRTPHLARFAREADAYVNAISNASWSLPGHASLFTGRNVSEHRTDHTREAGFSNSLPAALLTAQEIFAAEGYRTSCITANPLISPQTGLARGFERYRSPSNAWMFAAHPLRLLNLAAAGRQTAVFFQIVMDVSGPNIFSEAAEIVNAALGETDGEPRALYLFLNFMDAHTPHSPAPDEPLRARLALLRHLVSYLGGGGSIKSVTARHGEVLRDRYRWRVEQMDGELGRLFGELRQRGWYDEMLIVVTADHGQAMGENPARGYWGHHSSFEPAVRIPLLIKAPRQRQGRVMPHVVQQTDVLPALLVMAGRSPREGLQSRVLDPSLELPVITEWYPSDRGRGVPYPRLGLYRGRYKLVLEGHGEREFLYDLDQSPNEEVDVRSRQSGLAAAMRAELDATLRRSRESAPDVPATLDPAVEEQLRALGYVN